MYKVKYERLSDWCAVCGHLRHVHKEHGDGVHPPLALVFKELRASWFMRAGPGLGDGRSRGARSGRGRGNMNCSGRSDSGFPENEDDLDATMEDADPSKKRTVDQLPGKTGKGSTLAR